MFFNMFKLHKTGFTAAWRMTGLFFLSVGVASCTTMMRGDSGLKTKNDIAEAGYGMGEMPGLLQGAHAALQRGGGRAMIGKPYQIKGKWYYPAQDPAYSRIGRASWYGSEFHGKLTANGEIFDMNYLTAAHPTMPLPSYARVTNLENGASLIVRVNDRGPFADNRLIDLSRRAAELLHYKNSGLANVKVDYIGPAPVHGQDDTYLMASYRLPGHQDASALSAADGHTITAAIAGQKDAPAHQAMFPLLQRPILPEYGPRIEPKPTTLSSAFVEKRDDGAMSEAFAAILKPAHAAFPLQHNSARDDYIAVGSFRDAAVAKRLAMSLGAYGRVESVQNKDEKGNIVYSLSLFDAPDPDAALQTAWNSGAVDAFIARPH